MLVPHQSAKSRYLREHEGHSKLGGLLKKWKTKSDLAAGTARLEAHDSLYNPLYALNWESGC